MQDARLRSLALAALIGAASGLLAGEVQLRYNAKAGYRETGPARVVKLKARASPEQKPAGEPKYASSNPAYFALKLGPKQAASTIVLDESGGTGTGYDRLYADANGNGSLSDDEPVRGTVRRQSRYDSGLFGAATILVDYGERKAPWRFAAYYVTDKSAGGRGTQLSVRAVGYYEGEVSANGKTLKVAVVDADTSGCFNDAVDLAKAVVAPDGRFFVWSDRVLVDLNGDGRFDHRGAESLACAKYLPLDGAYYKLSVAAGGQSLALTPAEVPMGSLAREGGGEFSLGLLSPECGVLAVKSQGGRVALPAGTYKLTRCSVRLKSEGGAVWGASGTGTASGKTIEVAAGKPTIAKFGPPLLVGATVRVLPEGTLEAVKPGSTLRLGLKVSGQRGELYKASALYAGGRRPPAPTVRVVGKDGTLVASGSFRYG